MIVQEDLVENYTGSLTPELASSLLIRPVGAQTLVSDQNRPVGSFFPLQAYRGEGSVGMNDEPGHATGAAADVQDVLVGVRL